MKILPTLLLPFSWLYGIVTAIRNKLFDWGLLPSEQYDVPVLCVGNLSVGGTGKTPHTEYLVRLLRRKYRVAVLSRGYKRRSRGFQLAEGGAVSAAVLGDEPYQIKRKFPDVTVAVDADRRNGMSRLLSLPPEARPEVVVLDDAYQHRYVKPSFTLLLTDYRRLFTRDKVLPSGRLREWRSGASRADAIVVTKCPANIGKEERERIKAEVSGYGAANVYFTYIKYDALRPVFSSGKEKSLEDLRQFGEVLVLAGIAHPESLCDKVGEFAEQIRLLAFPDHHDFGEKDIRQVEKYLGENPQGKLVVTTEKDAVRLVANPYLSDKYKPYFYYLPITIGFCGEEQAAFDEQIVGHIVGFKK